MFMKALSYCKTANLEEYRKVVQSRRRWLQLLCVLGVFTILFSLVAAPRLVPEGDHGDFIQGFYLGVGSAMAVCGLYLDLRLAARLKDEAQLKAARIKAGDERLQAIAQKAQVAAGLATVAVLYVAMLIGGLFSFQLLVFCVAVVLVFFACFMAFYKYYENRL